MKKSFSVKSKFLWATLFSTLFTLSSFSEGYTRHSNTPQVRRRTSSYDNPEPILNPPADELAKAEEPNTPFNAYLLPYSVGFEGPNLPVGGSGSNPSVLSSAAVSFGAWVNKTLGYEVYLGHSKGSGSATVETQTVTNAVTKSKSVKTTYSGADQPRTFIFGGAVKYRLYQYKHFGLSTDFLFSFTPGFGVNYNSAGSNTLSIADTDVPGNYQVAEAGMTNIDRQTSALLRLGPRFNVEYNFPYLPNLLLGFSTGILVGFGGSTTTTTTVYNKTVNYVNNNPGTPSVDNQDVTTSETSPGGSSTTYAIGGTGLNITGSGLIPISVIGTFRIRYAF